MQKSLNTVGCFIVAVAAIIGFFLIFSLFIRGGVWVADKVLPVLFVFSVGVFIFNVIICLPLAFFKRTKEFSGKALFLSSYLYGILLWLGCLVVTFKIWGWVGIVIGLILLGIGIVPIALVATILSGLWIVVFHIIVLGVIIWVTRSAGVTLLKDCYAFGNPESPEPEPEYNYNNTSSYTEASDDIIDVKPIDADDEYSKHD